MLSGRKLKNVRIYKEIAQKEIAKAVGVTKSYISMLENEKQAIPKDIYIDWVAFMNYGIISERAKKKIN